MPESSSAQIRVVTLTGDLDSAELAQATKLLASLDGAHIAVIDMRTVTYLDSAALGMLIELKRRVLDGGGSVRIVSKSKQLARLLALAGLERSVTMYEDLSSAIVP